MLPYKKAQCLCESTDVFTLDALDLARAALSDPDGERAFYVLDADAVRAAWAAWRGALPGVAPYYAVKCNPAPGLLRLLADLGAGFDCASPDEMDRVAALGVSPDRVLYANPCKRRAELRHALAAGVTRTVVDAADEIDKIADVCGGRMAVLLRIYASDPAAQCPLSNKYGAHADEWDGLLRRVRDRGLDLAGVSFHVGSGASTPAVFAAAVADAARCLAAARALGLTPTVLDVGGGFAPASFQSVAAALREALQEHAPDLTVVAEPGRFFAERAAHLAAPVIGTRLRGGRRHYWIPESVYGAFNCLLYDHAAPPPPRVLLRRAAGAGETHASDVWGSTCDGLDRVVWDAPLPDLALGDWLLFEHMGAYTSAGASDFNGLAFHATPTILCT